jgi:hypothetical protein
MLSRRFTPAGVMPHHIPGYFVTASLVSSHGCFEWSSPPPADQLLKITVMYADTGCKRREDIPPRVSQLAGGAARSLSLAVCYLTCTAAVETLCWTHGSTGRGRSS